MPFSAHEAGWITISSGQGSGERFARPDGTPTHPEVLGRTFDRIVSRTKLPSIRLHDVRHTHASLLLKAGVPVKVVNKRLGHATASFTLDVYSWVLPGRKWTPLPSSPG